MFSSEDEEEEEDEEGEENKEPGNNSKDTEKKKKYPKSISSRNWRLNRHEREQFVHAKHKTVIKFFFI